MLCLPCVFPIILLPVWCTLYKKLLFCIWLRFRFIWNWPAWHTHSITLVSFTGMQLFCSPSSSHIILWDVWIIYIHMYALYYCQMDAQLTQVYPITLCRTHPSINARFAPPCISSVWTFLLECTYTHGNNICLWSEKFKCEQVTHKTTSKLYYQVIY